MVKYSLQCVGGPLEGHVVEVTQEPRHGDKYMLSDWDSVVAAPDFSDESKDICQYIVKAHEYTFVLFSGDGLQRFVLAYDTRMGIHVLDALLATARKAAGR